MDCASMDPGWKSHGQGSCRESWSGLPRCVQVRSQLCHIWRSFGSLVHWNREPNMVHRLVMLGRTRMTKWECQNHRCEQRFSQGSCSVPLFRKGSSDRHVCAWRSRYGSGRSPRGSGMSGGPCAWLCSNPSITRSRWTEQRTSPQGDIRRTRIGRRRRGSSRMTMISIGSGIHGAERVPPNASCGW